MKARWGRIFADMALPDAQGLGDDGRVFLRPGFDIEFGVAAVADEALGAVFHHTGGDDLPVGELVAHVGVVHAAGKDEGHELAGKIFHDQILHDLPSCYCWRWARRFLRYWRTARL